MTPEMQVDTASQQKAGEEDGLDPGAGLQEEPRLVAERLAWRPLTEALVEGRTPAGSWSDRTDEYNARRKGASFFPEALATRYELQLVPLPCWQGLSVTKSPARSPGSQLQATTASMGGS